MLDHERILAKIDELDRNILVHEYGRIDNAIVYEVITERLGDFEVFKKEILKVLQGK